MQGSLWRPESPEELSLTPTPRLLQHPGHQAQRAPFLMISFSRAKNQLLARFRDRQEGKSILGVFLTKSLESKAGPNKDTHKHLKSMSTPPQGHSPPEFSSSFAFSRTKLQFAPLT